MKYILFISLLVFAACQKRIVESPNNRYPGVAYPGDTIVIYKLIDGCFISDTMIVESGHHKARLEWPKGAPNPIKKNDTAGDDMEEMPSQKGDPIIIDNRLFIKHK